MKKINEQPEFTEINSTTYYREIKVEGDRRYILCFNPQLFTDQRNAREKHIELLKDEIFPDLNSELKSARKSRQYSATESKFKKIISKLKLSSFLSVELNETTIQNGELEVRTFQGKLKVDDAAKKESIKLDGFWMLVTNLSERDGEKEFVVSSENALRPYRDKVIIEDAFRDIKSFLEIAPVYVWLEKHVKSHYTICVLAYLINRTISNLLKEHDGNLSADVKTHISAYKELAKGSVDEIYIKNLDQSSYCLTELTKKQKEILRRLDSRSLSSADNLLEKFNNKFSDPEN